MFRPVDSAHSHVLPPAASAAGRKLNSTDQLIVSSIRPEYKLAILNINLATADLKFVEHGTGYPKYPTYSYDGEWVIFSSESQGKNSLFISSSKMVEDPRKLTDNDSFEGQAAVSSDGFIYFTSSRNGQCDIYRAPFTPESVIQMKDAVNMTKGRGSNFSPSISPDGKWLAFTSNRHSKEQYPGPVLTANYRAGAVYVMPTTDSDMAVKVSDGVDLQLNPTWEGTPTWSRDGKSITYYSVRNQHCLLYKYDIESGNITQVGPNDGKTLFPFYTPKENHLSYTHYDLNSKKWELYTESENGTTHQPIQYATQQCWGACFSPDGSMVANITLDVEGEFLVEEAENPHASRQEKVNTYNLLFSMKDGDDIYGIEEMSRVVIQRRDAKPEVIADPKGAFGIAKAPGKNWLLTTFGRAFQDDPAEKADIYKLAIDKSSQINLTEELGGRNVFPTISEDGNRVVFVHQKFGSKDKQLFLTDSKGSFFTQLTFEKGIHTMPSISSDGKRIVFSYTTDKITYKLKTLHLTDDGKIDHLEDITLPGTVDSHPVFSRKGDQIAFSSNRGGLNEEFPISQMFFNPQPDGDIYVKEGKNPEKRVTNTPFEQSTPSYAL